MKITRIYVDPIWDDELNDRIYSNEDGEELIIKVDYKLTDDEKTNRASVQVVYFEAQDAPEVRFGDFVGRDYENNSWEDYTVDLRKWCYTPDKYYELEPISDKDMIPVPEAFKQIMIDDALKIADEKRMLQNKLCSELKSLRKPKKDDAVLE